MDIALTPEQDEAVRRAIAAGRIARPEDAVAEAMTSWMKMERQRMELLASLDAADAEYERGESVRIDAEEDARALITDIKASYSATLAFERDGTR